MCSSTNASLVIKETPRGEIFQLTGRVSHEGVVERYVYIYYVIVVAMREMDRRRFGESRNRNFQRYSSAV